MQKNSQQITETKSATVPKALASEVTKFSNVGSIFFQDISGYLGALDARQLPVITIQHECVKCKVTHNHKIELGVTKLSQLWCPSSTPSSKSCGARCFDIEKLETSLALLLAPKEAKPETSKPAKITPSDTGFSEKVQREMRRTETKAERAERNAPRSDFVKSRHGGKVKTTTKKASSAKKGKSPFSKTAVAPKARVKLWIKNRSICGVTDHGRNGKTIKCRQQPGHSGDHVPVSSARRVLA